MINRYIQIRDRARRIACRFPPPDFYKDFAWAHELSGQIFSSDAVVFKIRSYIDTAIDDDYGHGRMHAHKVALDAGALLFIDYEKQKYAESYIRRRVCIAQCAGLLHDIERKQKHHAIKGAVSAGKILESLGVLTPLERDDIRNAIRNHEAFTDMAEIRSSEGNRISDCLYDADKFRWGPDNFTDTIWSMVSFHNTPLTKFLEHYPRGMQALKRIRSTFRTETGKQYGPQFIDIGLGIGRELYQVLTTEFAHLI